MLRKSKDDYSDRKVRKRFRRLAEEPLVRVMLGLNLPGGSGRVTPAGDDEPGSGDDQPCGDHFISDEMECHQGGGSEAAGGLTERDLLLIHDQARLQHADSPEQIQGLTDAWNAAKYAVNSNPDLFQDPGKTEEFALLLASLIEPRNARGYRQVPVTFGPGKPPAVDADKVPRAMESLWMAYSEQLLEPDEWYHEFEKVHPLEDGNGRLGDIMWKIAHVRRGEEWPDTHPPDLFGTDTSDLSAPMLKE